jgi:hypothetical protein
MPGFYTDRDSDIAALFALADPPNFALTTSGAGPTFAIGAGVAVDVPIFAIDYDDRAGVTIAGGGSYFVVADMFDFPGQTVQIFAWSDIRGMDGGTGNVSWTVSLISGINLGTGGEVVFEATDYISDTSSNVEVTQAGSGESLRVPGSATPYEFGARISHTSTGRNWTQTGDVVAGFRQEKVF